MQALLDKAIRLASGTLYQGASTGVAFVEDGDPVDAAQLQAHNDAFATLASQKLEPLLKQFWNAATDNVKELVKPSVLEEPTVLDVLRVVSIVKLR